MDRLRSNMLARLSDGMGLMAVRFVRLILEDCSVRAWIVSRTLMRAAHPLRPGIATDSTGSHSKGAPAASSCAEQQTWYGSTHARTPPCHLREAAPPEERTCLRCREPAPQATAAYPPAPPTSCAESDLDRSFDARRDQSVDWSESDHETWRVHPACGVSPPASGRLERHA